MTPRLAVVQLSPSFEQIWARLVESAGGRYIQADASAVETLRTAAVIIVAAGGCENAAADAVKTVRAAAPSASVAVAATVENHRIASQIIRAGADEYFALPGDMEMMSAWLTSGLRSARDQDALRHEVTTYPGFDFSRLIGRSPALCAALEVTAKIIPHANANVLVTGETGTGKELIAQAIHHNGPRAHYPFVDINCSALPSNLVEAELFGYEAGAFTDARVAKPGLLEIANRGTLFLDEIGELPMELQAKLLRVLDDRHVRRLGSNRATRVDIRVIAATHVDLERAVADGRFRQDLYFRLNVLAIDLPPLRERGDDVLLLAEHFVRELAGERKHRFVLDERTRRVLLEHHWPGNVRELRNAVERAVALGSASLLPRPTTGEGKRPVGRLPFPADMESIQEAAALAMLARHRGNKSAAAAALGISRKRLYALLQSGTARAHGQGSSVHIRPSAFVQERLRTPAVGVADLERGLWHVSPASVASEAAWQDTE